MKGIYLTEECKQEIEAKINDYEKSEYSGDDLFENKLQGRIDLLKEILSSATILPVEESWTTLDFKHLTYSSLMTTLPNGVVIQSK